MSLLKELDQKDLDELGQRVAPLRGRALPDLPKHHRRRHPADVGHDPRSAFRCKLRGAQRAPRSSTGPCPKSGIFEMPISRVPDGKRVVDFQQCNLHVMNYSTPVHADHAAERTQDRICSRFPNIRTGFLTERPTTRRTGDFVCRTTRCWRSRTASTRCCIDSTLEDGHLTYGECYLPGAVDRRGPDFVSCLPSVAGE